MSEEVTNEETVVEEPTIPQAEQTQENVQLSFADLAAVVQIIDVVSSRGAIRGEEMTSVGNIRDRIAAFVKQAQAQAEQSQEAA